MEKLSPIDNLLEKQEKRRPGHLISIELSAYPAINNLFDSLVNSSDIGKIEIGYNDGHSNQTYHGSLNTISCTGYGYRIVVDHNQDLPIPHHFENQDAQDRYWTHSIEPKNTHVDLLSGDDGHIHAEETLQKRLSELETIDPYERENDVQNEISFLKSAIEIITKIRLNEKTYQESLS